MQLLLHKKLFLFLMLFNLVTNGGKSCFSDGWIISPTEASGISRQEEHPSALLRSDTASSAEGCQRLCQGSGERCVLWEWDVLQKHCRLWGTGITLRRVDNLPLGLSAYSSPFDEDEPVDTTGAQNKDDRMRKRLESMRAVVGPSVCAEESFVQFREGSEDVLRAAQCTFPTGTESDPVQSSVYCSAHF